MKILPQPPIGLIVLTAFLPFALSQWMLYHAIDCFVSDQKFAGVKFTGLSIIFLGGCLDPINFAWLAMPFCWRSIVAPAHFSRFFWPFYVVGAGMAVTGWLANHWFHSA